MAIHKKFPILSDSDREEILRNLVSGEYYPIPSDMVLNCALPLALGGLKGYPDSEMKKIGAVLGVRSSSTGVACNGIPIFMEARIVTREDWDIIISAYKRYDVRKEEQLKGAFLVDEEGFR